MKSRIKKEEFDYSWVFEYTMRQFFGSKAEDIADDFYDKKLVKKWFIKALNKMTKDINYLDTTTRHKEILIDSIERIKSYIKDNLDPVIIIAQFFMLCSRLLGYDYFTGTSYHNLFYHQSKRQYYKHPKLANENNGLDLYRSDLKNVFTKQKEVVNSLTKEGFSGVQIGMILGLSEFQIKKIKKGL